MKLLAIIFVIMFYSRLDYFIYSKLDFLAPLYLNIAMLIIYICCGGKIIANSSKGNVFLILVMLYIIMVITGALFGFDSSVGYQSTRSILYGAFFLYFSVLILQFLDHQSARSVFLFLLLFSVLNVTAEFFFAPGIYSSMPSRAAGFYTNPNGCAIAIIMAYIFALFNIKSKYKFVIVTLTTVAITVTFSRVGYFLWIVVLFLDFFVVPKKVPKLHYFYAILAIFIIAIILQVLPTFLENDDILKRLTFQFDDISSLHRQELFNDSFEKISISMMMLGHSYYAPEEYMPHNIYLRMLVEHGVLGIVLYSILIVKLVAHVGFARENAVPWVLFIAFVIWGMFDHNMLDNPVTLIAFAYIIIYNTRHVQST